jgi:hypothetical protein
MRARRVLRLLAPSVLCLVLGGPRLARAQSSAPDDGAIEADRPGIADGSRVIRAGEAQIEIGLQRERRTDGSARSITLFAPTLIRLGLTRSVEARIESNGFTRVSTEDAGVEDHVSGAAPVLLGFKWTMYDSHGDDARRSVGTIVRVAPPSGTADFRTTHTTGDVRIAVDWDFAPGFSLNPNVGVARQEDSGGQTFGTALAALTLNYLPSPALNPFVDVGYQSREESGGTWALVFDAGVAYIIGHDVQLDLSAGAGSHGTTPPHPFVAAGISVRASAFRQAGASALSRHVR